MPQVEQATNAFGAETLEAGNQLFSASSGIPFEETSNPMQIDTKARDHGPAMSLDGIVLEPDKVARLFHM